MFWDKRSPPLPPLFLPSWVRKGEEKKGGPVGPSCIQPPQCLEQGGGAIRGSPRLPPQTAPESPHGPHLDQPICLIINEWIQAVSELSAAHAATGPRQCASKANDPTVSYRREGVRGGGIKATPKEKRERKKAW